VIVLSAGATRMGAHLPAGASLTSVDVSPTHAAIARQVLAHADLTQSVTVVEGTVTTVLQRVMKESGIQQFDFVFIDHDKGSYLSDMLYILEHDLLADGAVVVADNIVFPGAPEYRSFVNSDERFRTQEYTSHVEYLPLPDVMTVSHFSRQ
jgi:catechol O-methyltransferase